MKITLEEALDVLGTKLDGTSCYQVQLAKSDDKYQARLLISGVGSYSPSPPPVGESRIDLKSALLELAVQCKESC